MKFFFDNNLPAALACALDEPQKGREDDVEQVIHLQDKFEKQVPDDHWISSLSLESDWVVITTTNLPRD
ncbi:MAG: hypothetical protein L0I62_08745 [Gammaproteobacteria bacterium]|nr:hypothetical protein [Gammaproteobacteria bacterium]